MILCEILYFLSLSRFTSSQRWLALVSKSKSHFWFAPQATGRRPLADQTKSAARAGQVRNAPVSRCRCFLPDLTGFTRTSRAVPNPGDTGYPQVAGNNNSNGELIHPHTEVRLLTQAIHSLRGFAPSIQMSNSALLPNCVSIIKLACFVMRQRSRHGCCRPYLTNPGGERKD